MWRNIDKEVPGIMDYVLIHDGKYDYDVARLVHTDYGNLWRSNVTGNIFSVHLRPYWMPIPIFVRSDVDKRNSG